jgi:hypothetical protein
MTLRVVYVKQFGHVLGALSTAEMSPPLEIPALVGDELPLRTVLDLGRTATIALKADQLAAAVVDDEPEVFDQPLPFGVELGPDDKPKPGLKRLALWDRSALPVLDEKTLDVTLPIKVAVATPVLAMITDGQDIRVARGDVPAGEDSVSLTVSVSKGMHGLLLLAPGVEGLLVAVNVA